MSDLNPTRTGIIEVLNEMGASMTIELDELKSHEEMGTIVVEIFIVKRNNNWGRHYSQD